MSEIAQRQRRLVGRVDGAAQQVRRIVDLLVQHLFGKFTGEQVQLAAQAHHAVAVDAEQARACHDAVVAQGLTDGGFFQPEDGAHAGVEVVAVLRPQVIRGVIQQAVRVQHDSESQDPLVDQGQSQQRGELSRLRCSVGGRAISPWLSSAVCKARRRTRASFGE